MPRKKTSKPKRAPRDKVRVSQVERSVRIVGERRVKSTPIKVSTSRYVSVSRRGIKSKSTTKVLRAIGRQKVSPVYTYTVRVRYKGRDGKMKSDKVEGLGVPTLRSARATRRVKKNGRQETAKEAQKRLVEREIERFVHQTVNEEWERYELGDTSTTMGRAKARAILKNVKQQQRVSFKVEFYRAGGKGAKSGAPSRRA